MVYSIRLALLTCVGLLACGSGGSSTPSDAGSSGDGNDGGAGSVALGPAAFPYGAVDLYVSARSYDVFASFEESGGDCTTQQAGACSIYSCTPYTPPPPRNAGTLTFGGGKIPLAVAPSKKGGYDQANAAMALYAPGDTVHLAASGGFVPAFALDAVAPGPIAWRTAPSAATRDSAITLTWAAPSAGPAGIMRVTGRGSSFTSFTCEAPARDGTLTVPAEALAALTGDTLYLSSDHLRSVRTKQGDWTVDLRIHADTVLADGHAAFWDIPLK